VTREGTRPFAALIAALLVAALLAACGGSDSDSSSSSTATTTTGSSAANEPAASNDSGSQGSSQAQQDGDQGQGNSTEGDQSQSPQSRQSRDGGSGSGSKEVATPLEVSGGGSDQFRVEGGDNSVQEYGEESDESELQEAAEIVHSFYVARAEEQWDTACSYLAKANIEQLKQLAAQSPQFKDAGCAPLLRGFTRPLPPAINREITAVDAGSLRREGEQAFLIYYGADHTVYAMPLRDEGGTWKVAALSGSALG
jgi:hypothetical protein